MHQPNARISVVIRHVAWVGIVAHSGFIPLFAWLGYPGLAWFNVGSIASWVLAASLNRQRRSTMAMWLLTTEVLGHACLATMTLGSESGFQYYLIPLVPFVMFNDRLSSRMVSGACVGVFAAFVALRAWAPVLPLDPRISTLIIYSNITIPFLALALITRFFRLASVSAEQRMERMALTDPLTGLYNRRHMDELLEDARRRFTATDAPFSVILADLDHFKEINDARGHAVGDRVLRAVATVFTEQLRSSDALARWGGEEFLVLLSGTKPEAALDVAQRLRAAAQTQLRKIAELSQDVTVTLGVAAFRPQSDITQLIKAADDALYSGKAAGRNRVVVSAAPA